MDCGLGFQLVIWGKSGVDSDNGLWLKQAVVMYLFIIAMVDWWWTTRGERYGGGDGGKEYGGDGGGGE
ncbi:hypothetical protein QVD17_34181 [Tagetes erecta]|uniref:Uncharacterized protein n=1 Tax=Tagetes erecta TaxID=13708 RepID=A0AAD8K0B5_TARER|nr:hypothetical protein QVD17_34181 [Tagetes erecta]